MSQSTRKKQKPTAIDLFSGCGGLTLGLKQAGFDVIGAVEICRRAAASYKLNHPEVHLWRRDVCGITGPKVLTKLGIKKGSLDLLAGCPPCQGFSTIRTRNGHLEVRDPRNDLLMEFLRLTKALLPRAVMMENVPGLTKYDKFEVFRKKMEEIGYQGRFEVLNAADYGVPQRRKRLIYIAGFGRSLTFARKRRTRFTVRQAIGDLPIAGESGDWIHDLPEHRTGRIQSMISRIPRNGGSRSDLGTDDQLNCHKNCDGFKDVYGRMKWDDVAPTITSGCFNPSKGRFLHPSEDRAITMREAAALQGFPIEYCFSSHTPKTELALMIGNALPVPFIRAHAEKIHKQLDIAG